MEAHAYWFIALLAGAVLLTGLLAGQLGTRMWLSEPLVGIAFGVVAGPVLGIFDLRDFFTAPLHALEEVARYTLGVALMGAALRLPQGWFARHWRQLLLVLILGMLIMWGVALGLGLLFGMSLLVAALMGAILTPTDPVMATAVVTGQLAEDNVAPDLRHLITAESGANDGLALAFVTLPLALLAQSGDTGWHHWLFKYLLWEIAVGAAFGALCGWLGGLALRGAVRHLHVEQVSLLSVGLAISFLILSAGRALELDGILSVFVGGAVLNAMTHQHHEERLEKFQSTAKVFFEQPVFVLFGLALPVAGWAAMPGWTFALAALVLLLRRLPGFAALSLLAPTLRPRKAWLYQGWFGPVGIATIFYATMTVRHTGNDDYWTLASLIVLMSAVVHGVTATPAARWMGAGGRAADASSDAPGAQRRSRALRGTRRNDDSRLVST